MIIVGSADKFIVRDVHKIPKTLYFARDFVHELLTGYALCRGLLLDFEPVLVGACHKEYVVSLRALEAADSVGQNTLVRVADMRFARSIRNSGCQIKLLFHCFLVKHYCLLKSIAQFVIKINRLLLL